MRTAGAVTTEEAHRFVESRHGAHEIEHVAQDPVQVPLQAVLGSRAWPVHHTVIQQCLLQQCVQVLRVCCNDGVQVCCSLYQQDTAATLRLWYRLQPWQQNLIRLWRTEDVRK